MKVSFCQTYGNDREQLLNIKIKDKKLLEFLGFFDINIISFHNCNKEIINHFKKNNNIPNLKFFINNNITYTQCIQRLLHTVKKLDAKYLFFYQDDTFSFNNENVNFNEFSNFIFNEDDIILNLQYDNEKFPNAEIYKKINDINVYINNTQNFATQGMWSFDDSPYICTTNYLSTIYDEIYLSCGDIWSAEHYLNYKFKTYNIKRFMTNFCLFKNYNFLGRNVWNRDYEIKTLKEKQLL